RHANDGVAEFGDLDELEDVSGEDTREDFQAVRVFQALGRPLPKGVRMIATAPVAGIARIERPAMRLNASGRSCGWQVCWRGAFSHVTDRLTEKDLDNMGKRAGILLAPLGCRHPRR